MENSWVLDIGDTAVYEHQISNIWYPISRSFGSSRRSPPPVALKAHHRCA